MGLPSPQAAE